eukprot:SAG11_NODE_1615_length_4578_cov_6.001786_6_plen_147_part_00
MTGQTVHWVHVKGHSKDGGNERADELVQWGKGDGPYCRLREGGGERAKAYKTLRAQHQHDACPSAMFWLMEARSRGPVALRERVALRDGGEETLRAQHQQGACPSAMFWPMEARPRGPVALREQVALRDGGEETCTRCTGSWREQR